MAHLTEVSVGNYTKLFFVESGSWVQVTETNTIPSPTDEAATVAIQQFGVDYQTTLPGSKTVAPIELLLNWNPSNATHVSISALYGTQATTKFYVEYTNGGGTESTYREFSARVGSNTIASEFDTGRTMSARLDIIGGLGAIVDVIPTP